MDMKHKVYKFISSYNIMEKNIFRITPVKNNESRYMVLPTDVKKHLGFEDGDDLFMMMEQGKHGKYITVWKAAKPKPPM